MSDLVDAPRGLFDESGITEQTRISLLKLDGFA